MPPAVPNSFRNNRITSPKGATVDTAALLALKAFAPKIRGSRPRFSSHMSGQYMSRSRGRGLEFAEVRHYQQGDDIRAIDWRVTARSGKPHTRLYIEEREKPVLIFCDLRATMQFGTRSRFKSVQAANLAALLAWGSLASGDRVGGIIAGVNGHSEVRPSLSHKTVAQYLSVIAQNCELRSPTNQHAMAQLLAEVRRVAKPGTSIYLISDFADWNENCDKQLALVSRHCNLTLLMVSDPLEYKLPRTGSFPFTDGNTKVVLSGSKHALQLAEHFQQRQQKLTQLCSQYKANFLSISTDHDAVDIAGDCLRGRYARR